MRARKGKGEGKRNNPRAGFWKFNFPGGGSRRGIRNVANLYDLFVSIPRANFNSCPPLNIHAILLTHDSNIAFPPNALYLLRLPRVRPLPTPDSPLPAMKLNFAPIVLCRSFFYVSGIVNHLGSLHFFPPPFQPNLSRRNKENTYVWILETKVIDLLPI